MMRICLKTVDFPDSPAPSSRSFFFWLSMQLLFPIERLRSLLRRTRAGSMSADALFALVLHRKPIAVSEWSVIRRSRPLFLEWVRTPPTHS